MATSGQRTVVLCVLLFSWCSALLALPPSCCARTVRPSEVKRGVIVALDEDAQRREKLRLLFGELTADRLAPAKPSASDPEFIRLVEGMQQLKWGATKLVDVSMALGPLEISLKPLLPEGESQLFCVRLDMPLGMVFEEETADDNVMVTRHVQTRVAWPAAITLVIAVSNSLMRINSEATHRTCEARNIVTTAPNRAGAWSRAATIQRGSGI